MRGGRGSVRRTLAVLAAGGLVAACGSSEAGGPRVGEPAPSYSAVTLEGEPVALDSFRGDVVLLNLWATWCAPCRQETPFLQSLYEDRRGEDLVVVGVSMDAATDVRPIRDFVEEFSVTYPILHDRRMAGMELYQVLGLPATFLIDRDGTLLWMRFGPVSETDGEFLDALDRALE